MTQQRISFLGLPIDTGYTAENFTGLLDKTDQARLVTFIQADAWHTAQKQPEYLEQLNHMTVVIPSGCDIACAINKIDGTKTEALSFDMHSLAVPFLKAVAERKTPLMLVGGAPAIDERVNDKLHSLYPSLNIIATVNGYGDMANKVLLVTEKNPACVLVDFQGPKTLAFLVALKQAGYKGLAIDCNGFFAETLRDDAFYPEWVKRYDLQFGYRLIADPAYSWMDFIKAYPAFVVLVTKALADKYLPKKDG